MSDVASLRLSPKMERAATLRSRGLNKADTRRDPQVGVSQSTMDRWCENPEFARRVEELRTSVDLQATEILQDSLTDAARVMRDIIAGKEFEGSVLCPGCGLDVTASVTSDFKSRQKAAQWLLDTYYKGKLPKTQRPDRSGAEYDGLDAETRKGLLERGTLKGEPVKDELPEDEEEPEDDLDEENEE